MIDNDVAAAVRAAAPLDCTGQQAMLGLELGTTLASAVADRMVDLRKRQASMSEEEYRAERLRVLASV